MGEEVVSFDDRGEKNLEQLIESVGSGHAVIPLKRITDAHQSTNQNLLPLARTKSKPTDHVRPRLINTNGRGRRDEMKSRQALLL